MTEDTLMTTGAVTEAEQQPVLTEEDNSSTPDQGGTQETPQQTSEQPNEVQKDAEDVVPEKYDFKFPEGSYVDSEVMSEFEEVAKELGLSQEKAQRIADFAPRLSSIMQAKQLEAIEAASVEWQKNAVSDKEFGGDKLQENLAVAKKALDAFASPEMRAMLGKYDAKENPTGTGLGNHPEIIRMFYRVGQKLSEDSVVLGGIKKADRLSNEEVFYGNSLKR